MAGGSAGNGAQQAKAKFEILLAAGLYTRWPPGVLSPLKEGPSVIHLGVVGPQQHAAELEKMAAARLIAGRHVVVRHFESAADVEPCQILFISSAVTAVERQALIKRFEDSPVLLAGESAGFCQEGGSLNFEMEGGKLRFILNPAALDQQKLRVDPRFSRLAHVPAGAARDAPPIGTTPLNEQNEPRSVKKLPPPHAPQHSGDRKAIRLPAGGKQPVRSSDVKQYPHGKRP